MLLERLAEAEEELAAACALVAARVPEAADQLDEVQRLHVEAAAFLRVAAVHSQRRRLPAAWMRVWGRLRTAGLDDSAGALEWLRDRELQLARRYTECLHGAAPGAWQRYMRVEHLLAMYEFGELVPA